MFVSSTYRTTSLQYTYRGAPLSAAYVCKLSVQNYFFTLHLSVSNLKYNLCLLPLPKGLLGYIKLISAVSYVKPMFVSSPKKIDGLH